MRQKWTLALVLALIASLAGFAQPAQADGCVPLRPPMMNDGEVRFPNPPSLASCQLRAANPHRDDGSMRRGEQK